METAIVLDGHLKSSLAIIRSLGRKGVMVIVGAERGTALGSWSRYATKTFVYPSPHHSPNAFKEALLQELFSLESKPLVYTQSDVTFLTLFTHQEEFLPYIQNVFPSPDSVEFVLNKAATNSFAKVHGVPIIPTYIPSTEEELVRIADTLTYPLVLKPRRTVSEQDGVLVFGSAEYIETKEDLVRLYPIRAQVYGESPLIQELIRGEEYGVEMVAHKGAPVALATHHRVRSLSPSGGASVVKEILEPGSLRSQLEEHALRLVSVLGWEGPIMCEFKVSSDTQVPYLMEINGRWWGSLPLTVASGVDMPYLYYRLAIHGELHGGVVLPHYPTVTRHFLGDCLNLLRTLSPLRKTSHGVITSRAAAVRNFFVLPHGSKGDIWDIKDPLPAFMEVFDMLYRLIHRL